MARQVTSPIKRLVTAAREIGRGNLEQAVDTSASDEIGYLSVRMEEMRQKLLTRERQLRQMLAGVAHEIRNPLGGIEIVDIPEDEPFGANVLPVGNRVVLPAAHPRTAELLLTRGYEPVAIDNSELLKAESGVTCSSLVFARDIS